MGSARGGMVRADTGAGEMIDWDFVALLIFWGFLAWLFMRENNK